MTFEEFQKNWEDEVLSIRSPQIRKGQSLINYLAKIWFNEYKRITSTEDDCFYVDDLIPRTLDHLKQNWHKYPN